MDNLYVNRAIAKLLWAQSFIRPIDPCFFSDMAEALAKMFLKIDLPRK